MSFGFGIGDFIAVGELCWKLYSQVYKVSRDAPEELRGLHQELGNLNNTIQLLIEELKDEDSVLKRSGDVRINLVNRVMSQAEETLKKMQQLSKRYAELQTPTKGQGKRLNPRIYWDRLKYSQELHTINDLRAKIMLHNSQLTLTLQGAQNSSLERIEKQNMQTDKKLDELRQLLSPSRAQRDRPVLTAPLDVNVLIELTDAFLQKAEFDNRPWASIGIDSWLQIGQWWLMKAESQLGAAPQSHEDHVTYNQGYINLLKACWILTDIIAIHPQRTHMGASNDRRAYHIQRLTQGATSKLDTLSTITFQLEDLLTCTLDIWNLPPSTALTPRRRNTGDQPQLKWQTHNGEILFQKFAEFQDDKLERSVECLVIIVMPSEQFTNALSLNLIVQNSMGQDLYKHQSTCNDFLDKNDLPIRFFAQQDKRLLDCILSSLPFFRYSPNPLPKDASMVYSAALLGTCARARQSLLDNGFQSSTTYRDIDALAQSRQEFQIQPTTHTSSILQQIVDRIVEYIKRCSEGFPTDSDRMFWTQRHQSYWTLIYWLCDTFEAFSELFEAIVSRSPNFDSRFASYLIRASLLREDLKVPQFLSSMNSNPNLIPNELGILFAVCNDDIAALKATISRIENERHYKWHYSWLLAWELAYTHLKWDSMKVLFSAPWVNLHCLYKALFWFVGRHKWDELQAFSGFIRLCDKYIPGQRDDDPICFKIDINEGIVHSCAEIIYDGGLHDLELFLDIAQRLGSRLDVPHSVSNGPRTQLAILPALASRNLSILKILSETCIASSSTEVVNSILNKHLKLEQSSPGYSPPNHFSSTVPRFPLDNAIAFILDLEIVDYLCQIGAPLQEETLRKLRLTTSVSDARKQNCHMKGLFYQICSTEFFRRLDTDPDLDLWVRCDNEDITDKPVLKTLMITGRIIFEGDCRHLYDINDVSSGLTWQAVQNNLYQGELKDAPVPIATSWPAPLSTQESWDNWRLKVIDILEEFQSLKS